MTIHKQLIGLSLLVLVGCQSISETPVDQSTSTDTFDPFVSVQDYTGEGYTLDGGKETQPIADENLKKIEETVKRFFVEEYKTEVIVHNVVGALNAATVFVESVGEPHFYTYAVVPIDVEHLKVQSEEVYSQNDTVENAIRTGIYGMAYDKEFTELNDFIQEVAPELGVAGITEEALANVKGNGYSTSFMYTSMGDFALEGLNEKYLENPSFKASEWISFLEENKVNSEGVLITIQLFMEDETAKPNEDALESIVTYIEQSDDLPVGLYSVYINDNKINKRTANGNDEHQIKRAHPYDIRKE
ncbi:DUF1672 family protein [Alkalicoccobacillus porphyridii]|uniref:DUF1672 family protein n=1 Tax=Alkalicoccobacillus porphyridii TaxID=2597270 RepID=A0A554A470_9BACI|nr:DUF1672 family protein [Alkalicoccobacillus porphyridii]TSB48489.1 DUF1672 family protein [Alkalicoccobacillus porphyridii]